MNLIERLFSQVCGINPDDIGLFPLTPDDLVPTSLWCDEETYVQIRTVYDGVAPGKGADFVSHLNVTAKQFYLRYWNDLLPYLVGPYWGIITKTARPEEAELVARVGSSFFYNSSIGMFLMPGLGMTFFRVQPSRHAGILPSSTPLGTTFDISSVQARLAANQWRVISIPGNKVDR